MITKPQSQRRAAVRTHARIDASPCYEEPAIKTRIKTCVSQDRFEARGLQEGQETQRAQDERAADERSGATRTASFLEALDTRTLLLEVVGKDRDIINAALNLCHRISNRVQVS